MQFLELAKKRYSVRAYKADPVEDNKLEQILEAARLAPTAANRQPFQIIVTHTAGKEAVLGRIYARPWFVQSPLVICVCGILSQAWVRRDGKSFCDVDVAIVMDHLTLAAADIGLGTCWIAALDEREIRNLLSVPDELRVLVVMPVGYTDSWPEARPRKALEEIVCYDKYS